MDAKNRFHTAHTFLWVRLEHVAVLVVSSALVLRHLEQLSWLHGLAAFAAIDLVGYLPGAIAQRRAGKGSIAPLFHHLYNFTHSYLVAGALIGLWAVALGHLEWAMLAVPIHLSIDRGLFGNTYKPTSLPFEPQEA